MALLNKITFPDTGLPDINGYLKINYIGGTKDKVDFELEGYVSREAAINPAMKPVYKKSFSFIPNVAPDAQEWLTQAYEYVKTTEGFENALDVLEEDQII